MPIMENANSPDAWYKSLPSLTRFIGTGLFIVTLMVVWGILDVRLLLLDWRLVYKQMHIWRLLTDYFFIGKFSFGWMFQMYFFILFSSKLEGSEHFSRANHGGASGGYLYFILIQVAVLNLSTLVMYWPSGKFLLGPALHSAIVYYWSRCEPWEKVSIWGFALDAYLLPFAMLLLNMLMGGSIQNDLFGIFSGHVYYYVKNVVPGAYNIDLFMKPPAFIGTAALFIEDFPKQFIGMYNRAASGGGPGANTTTANRSPPRSGINTLLGNQNDSNNNSSSATTSATDSSSGGGFFRRRGDSSGLYSGTGHRLGSTGANTNNNNTSAGNSRSE